ncbi:MAG: hypothetical protein AAFW87_12050 [Pseudomonadota bacterium]
MPNYTTELFALGDFQQAEFAMQLNTGAVGISADGNVLHHQVGASSGDVTKSTLNVGLQPVADSGLIAIEMDFFIPAGSPTDQVFLVDVESSSANTGTNPGVRVYLRDGLFRVDRAKIGEDQSWYAQHEPVTTDQWYTLRVVVVSGGEDTGEMRIYLNDDLVMQENGATRLTQEMLDPYNFNLVGGELDRVQLGLTANNGNTEAAVSTRDIDIQTYTPNSQLTLSVDVDPAVVVANSDRPVEIYLDNGGPAENSLNGTKVADLLKGSMDDEIINGFLGMDTIKGAGGNDLLNAGSGRDTVDGGGGLDIINGGGGNDTLSGGAGKDTISGGAGRDLIFGDSGADSIEGGTGNDTIDGGSGVNWLSGGSGKDRFVFTDANALNTISDFQTGQDVLDLRDLLDDAADLDFRLGKDEFQLGGPDGTGSGESFEMWLRQVDGATKLFMSDGAGSNGQVIAILENTDLDDFSLSDFMFF